MSYDEGGSIILHVKVPISSNESPLKSPIELMLWRRRLRRGGPSDRRGPWCFAQPARDLGYATGLLTDKTYCHGCHWPNL